ncbi:MULTISPECIES: heme-binding domain-containing protein [Flavobacteriaceae]|uniref:Cytochrome C n=2 Tax=Flavobacteriaceae TaxID=49546 RepID=A0A4Y8AUZ6_9FLAO|nr:MULTISPECIES: heme-binding domain-containing protein [Flavobacteriaceae]TEW76299.1 cytochrome C [Gramella jeungdoensis]GGK59597.1 heme-binding protein [Lutibacter litoralis]
MKKIFLGILIVIILIQFIRPEKNVSPEVVNDISTVMNVPKNVQEIIKTSCADCHSNNTKYPWYSEIAPVSWYLASHVNDGKKHLNFSEWAAYNKNQKEHIIKDLKKELKSKEMPLNSYLWIHKEAIVSPEQYKILLDWIDTFKVD